MTDQNKPSWKVRRRIIHLTLLFCMFCVLVVMFSADVRSVAEVIVVCAFGLGFATIGSYIFGAVWDDKNYMSMVKPGKPRVVNPVPVTPPADDGLGD